METKKYLYAGVGAPVAVYKSTVKRVEDVRAKLNERSTTMTKDLEKQVELWAAEGEEFLGKLGDTKAIDELTDRVDFDQMQVQVHKLRDQLEDLIDTWRANFRPGDKPAVKAEKIEVEEAPKPAAKKPATTAAKKPAARKTTPTAARKPAARKTTSTSAKTESKAS
jgi:hypothetical protein